MTTARTLLASAASLAILAAAPAFAQHHGSGAGSATQTHSPAAGKRAVNAICPVGKEPVNGRTFVEYEGRTVGFCCPGCDKAFLGWSKDRKDAFIARALAGDDADGAADAQPADAAPVADRAPAPFPLSTCPVSGRPLGSMGDPVVKTYDGREVRFCCAACPPKFEADPERYTAEIDRKIVATQLPFYPLTTCVIAGGPLGSMGEPDNYVHDNRLVRFCCAACRPKFNADPQKHLAALDAAAAEDQRADYPLTACPVSGQALGSMGEPAEVVVAGRLVRLCCAACEPGLRADVAKHLTTLDDAWRKAGRPNMPEPGAR